MLKNKKTAVLGIFIFACVASIFGMTSVKAEDTPNYDRINLIKTNCSTIKNHLARVRSDDALLRVDLGQRYEKISDGLMEKMNTRIVINKINGANLIADSALFNDNIRYFREDYNIYERELTALYEMDCSNKTKDFSDQLDKVRQLRKKLKADTTKAVDILKKYQQELNTLKGKM